jgi:hypothetical protein
VTFWSTAGAQLIEHSTGNHEIKGLNPANRKSITKQLTSFKLSLLLKSLLLKSKILQFQSEFNLNYFFEPAVVNGLEPLTLKGG